jgi:hypothetical protein
LLSSHAIPHLIIYYNGNYKLNAWQTLWHKYCNYAIVAIRFADYTHTHTTACLFSNEYMRLASSTLNLFVIKVRDQISHAITPPEMSHIEADLCTRLHNSNLCMHNFQESFFFPTFLSFFLVLTNNISHYFCSNFNDDIIICFIIYIVTSPSNSLVIFPRN